MHRVCLCCLGILLLTGVSLNRLAAVEYDRVIRLKDMSLEWRLDGDRIHVRVTAWTAGWVAVGFNPADRMEDANIIIGYVMNGRTEIQDHFGVRPQQHLSDAANGGRNDLTASGGSEAHGRTSLWFTLPLESGDANDGRIDPQKPTKVILAYGPDRDNVSSRHVFRTTLHVNLSDGSYQ